MYDYYQQSYRMIEESRDAYSLNPKKTVCKFIAFNFAAMFKSNNRTSGKKVGALVPKAIDYGKINKMIQATESQNYSRLVQNLSDRKQIDKSDCDYIRNRIEELLSATGEVNNTKTVPVVFITDNRYALPTSVAISSLMFNSDNPYKYDVHVIGDALDEDLRELIRKSGIYVNIIDSSQSFNDVDFEHTHVTKAALNKFYISELLPHIDKVLYLDSDMLFLRDLSDLYNENLEDRVIGAVPDYHILTSNYVNVLHSRGLTNYFNSGMLLMDIKRMRDESMAGELLKTKLELIQDVRFTFMDQDALNIYFYGDIKYLPVKYNFLNAYYTEQSEYDMRELSGESIDEVMDAYNKPYVLHIGGSNKPWNSLLGEKLFLYQYYREVNRTFREIGGRKFG